ncbi:tetratricopeptide repeat protein [Manganibacter manganicus]|nr:tetratricopeptide repeat protein [Pseudaminobacter manganicus]
MGRGPPSERIVAEEGWSSFDDESKGPPVSQEETLAELERVLTDPNFRSSERNKRFLRYVMEKVLEGATDKIKAYSVAVDVFGRPADFDPIIDPIVRIEAMRLRSSLSHYYEVHGQQSLLRIGLPKGGYVPTIRRRRPSPEHVSQTLDKTVTVAGTADAVSEEKHSAHASKLFRGLSAALVASGVALAGFALWRFVAPPTHTVSERPRTILTVSAGGDETVNAARDLKEALLIAMSRFQTVTIVDGSGGPARRHNTQMTPSTPAIDAAYQIAVDYRSTSPQQTLWWQVSDRNGVVLTSHIEPIPQNAEERDRIVARLANRIAGLRGTISNSELRKDYAAPTLGNGCVLRAYRSLHSLDPARLRTAKACLEQTIKVLPGHAVAHAVLSRVLPMLDSAQPPASAGHALDLANTATVLSPTSAVGARSQMEALFHLGYTDAALRAGRRAMTLNPYDPDAVAAFAGVLALTGRWDEAIPLIEKARDLTETASPEIHAVLAMDAYRRGAYAVALSRLVQSNPAPCCEVSILHVATLGQLEMQADAQTEAASLQRRGLGSEASVHRYMTKRHFDPGFVALLQDGISKASLPSR